jgi:hypothetical protein
MAFLLEGVITSNGFYSTMRMDLHNNLPISFNRIFPRMGLLFTITHLIDRVRLIILLISIFLHLLRLMALLLLRLVGLQACVSVRHPSDDQLTWRGLKRPEKKKEKQKRRMTLTLTNYPQALLQ